MKCHECGKDVGDEYYRFDEMGGEVVLCPSCTWAKPCLTKWVERHKVRKIDLQALRGGEPGSIIELPTPLTDRIDALERQIENLIRFRDLPLATCTKLGCGRHLGVCGRYMPLLGMKVVKR